MKQRALNTFFATEWAMEPNYLRWMAQLAAELCTLSTEERSSRLRAVEAERGERLEYAYDARVRDGVAILPVKGPISPYMDFFTYYSGGTAISTLARDFNACLNDSRVNAILFEFDTPGGAVNGLSELARMIYAARGRKPMVARVRNQCCSAGYWLAAAAGDIVVADTAQAPCIGVYLAYYDSSKAEAKAGFREIVFRSAQAPKKNLDPATKPGADLLQARLDALGQVFVEAVAEYRDVDVEDVLANYGQGDVFVGQALVDAGIADRMGSFEETLAELARHSGTSGGFNGRLVGGALTAEPAGNKKKEAAGGEGGGAECPEHADGDCPDDCPNHVDDEEASALQYGRQDLLTGARAPHTTPAAALGNANEGVDKMSDQDQTAGRTDAGAAPDANEIEQLRAQLAEQTRLREEAEQRAAAAGQTAEEAAAELAASQLRARLTGHAAGFFGDVGAKVSFMEKLAGKFGEDSAELASYVEDQNAQAEQIRQGGLFGEQGSSRSSATETGTSATEQINRLAAERAQKDGITVEKALGLVAQENGDLYEAYRNEQIEGGPRK